MVIDVNLMGAWRVTAAALAALRESRGRVVNVASGLAHIVIPFATAYCMSKRGLVAYSDCLRVEHGNRLTVTTVYPGYIKTKIHDSSAALGVSLDSTMPAEPLESAAAALVRAALGPPVRDLATARKGTVQYALARTMPRRVVDRVIASQLRRLAGRGHFDRSELTRDFAARQRF